MEAVHILGLVGALKRLGHEVDILSPPGVELSETPVPASQGGKLARVWKLLSRMMPELLFEVMEIAYNWTAIRRLSRQVSARDYDLLYERYALLNFSGFFVARRRKIPLVLEINYTIRNPLYRKRSRMLQSVARMVEQWIFRHSQGFVAVSTALKEQLIQSGVAAERIVMVPNAVDPELFHPDVSGARVRQRFELEGKQVIGFVGGFYPWHGLDLLLDALPPILSEVEKVAVLLIGDGPIRRRLESKVETIGLTGKVHFIGSIPHAGLPEYVAAFNVAVMPDSNDYGSPMKIYEYMSMGKPVVAPRLGPLEDGIQDGVVGLLFTPHDPRGLIWALIGLLNDPRRCAEMGRNARRHVMDNHTWQRNAERILGLVQRTQFQNPSSSGADEVAYESAKLKD